MQVKAVGQCKYITSNVGQTKDNSSFYTCTMLDEKGESLKFYTSAEMYGKVQTLHFGDEMVPVFDIYIGKSGVSARLMDFMNPPTR